MEIKWIKYGKSFSEFSEEFKESAGMLIEVDKTIILIGDINEAGGVCDDCKGVSSEDIVTKHAKIFDMEELRAYES